MAQGKDLQYVQNIKTMPLFVPGASSLGRVWSREEKAQAWINIYTRLLGLELNNKMKKEKEGEKKFLG